MEGDRERHFYFSKGNEIQEMISSVLDQISIGIVYINEGKMVYSNKKGKEFMNLMEKDSSVQKKLDELIKKKKNFHTYFVMANEKYFSLDGIFFPEGASTLIIEDMNEKHGELVDSMITGTAIIKDEKCVFFNKKFYSLVGKKNFFEIIHRNDREKLKREIKKPSKGKNFCCEVRIKKRGGKKAWVEIYGRPIMYGNEKAILLDMLDITKRKEMEEELERTKEMMEKALEKERKFVEDISHYFFNPLCIAKGYIDLSLRNVDPETRRKLQITRDAVMRVESVVKHVVMEGQIYE